MSRTIRVIALLSACGLIAAACTDDADDSASSTSPVDETPGTEAAEFVTVSSEDGDLVVEVPAGERDAEAVTVSVLDPVDYPPELAGADETPGTVLYRLEPDGAEFSEPVQITRRLDAANFGLGPGELPLVMGVTYSADGTYELLEEINITRDGDDVYVTGGTTHFSDVLYVRGEGSPVQPLMIEVARDEVETIGPDFSFPVGPGLTVDDVRGLGCGSDTGRVHVSQEVGPDDIGPFWQEISDPPGTAIVGYEVIVEVNCTENGQPGDPPPPGNGLGDLPAFIDTMTYAAGDHPGEPDLGGGDPKDGSAVPVDIGAAGIPAGFDPHMGLVNDLSCDGLDDADEILNPPMLMEPLEDRYHSVQKISFYACLVPLLVLTPNGQSVEWERSLTIGEIEAIGEFRGFTPGSESGLNPIEITEAQVIFADGFESGDVTRWSLTVP